MSIKSSVILVILLVFLVLSWPLSGLFELSCQCDHPAPIERTTFEKVGPIDTLLVEGNGMHCLYGKIDIEEPDFPNTAQYKIIEAENYPTSKNLDLILKESDLRSRYKVVIERPKGDFLHRYLTKAWIRIEDRTTGTVLLKTYEYAWGGGLAGVYIGLIITHVPFYFNFANYFSCGYAGREIIQYRNNLDLYKLADQKLLEQVFIFRDKSQELDKYD
ncbi:MAG TPA: hypothetical protein PKI91_01390 [Smithella sp.]|nr:hypothetical protein [Smithella sp.]MDM7985991.1 hypothetical protein [Smithella sp.]HNY49194.1 hypothetical protein [Smithella sp.]HOU49639.1 hypothetical protein [Smithella sp.]